MLDDGQGGRITAEPTGPDQVQLTITGTVWATPAEVRAFASELLQAWPNPSDERVGG